MQPGVNITARDMISVYERCIKILGKEIADKILFKIRKGDKSYPVTSCGKRSRNKLQSEKNINTIKVFMENGNYRLMYTDEYNRYMESLKSKDNNDEMRHRL